MSELRRPPFIIRKGFQGLLKAMKTTPDIPIFWVAAAAGLLLASIALVPERPMITDVVPLSSQQASAEY